MACLRMAKAAPCWLLCRLWSIKVPASLDRLANEYALRDELAAEWALRPLELVREGGRTILLLEDPGGEPLSLLLGDTMAVPAFLRMAIGIAAAVGKAHQRGIIHKDIKPANIWVNRANGQVRLTGFGIASRAIARAAIPRPARGYRRHLRLHGTRADRPDESVDRFAQ